MNTLSHFSDIVHVAVQVGRHFLLGLMPMQLVLWVIHVRMMAYILMDISCPIQTSSHDILIVRYLLGIVLDGTDHFM